MNIWKDFFWLNKIVKWFEVGYLYMVYFIFMFFKKYVIYNLKLIFEEIFYWSKKCGVYYFYGF